MPMPIYTVSKTRLYNLAIAFLITVFFIGCGGKDSTTTPPPSTPTLASVTPNSATAGTTTAVTVAGTNFASGATINIDGSGVTASNVSFVSSTALNANFVISPTAAAGPRNVTVTSGGTTTAAVQFTVNAIAAPALNSFSPGTGIQGQNVSVTFNGSNFVPGVTTFSLTKTGGTGVTVTSVNISNSGTATAIVNIDSAATIGNWDVKAINTSGGSVTASAKFSVVALPPAAVSSFPAQIPPTNPIPTNSLIVVKFNKPMQPSVRDAITVRSGTTQIMPFEFPIYDDTNHTVTFIPNNALPGSSPITVQITGAKDADGNPISQGTLANPLTLTTTVGGDFERPVVNQGSVPMLPPGPGAPINTRVVIVFSHDMNCLSLTPTPGNPIANFTVTQQGASSPIPGTVFCSGKFASFVPASPLLPNTTYNISIVGGIDSGARDIRRNNLLATFNSIFSTATATDNVLPTAAPSPADAARGVPVTFQPTVTFSKAMDGTTIDGGTFTLTGPGGIAVTGVVNYDPATKKATFTPADASAPANLAPSSSYTATIVSGSNGVRDTSGNSLAVNLVWSFTTAP